MSSSSKGLQLVPHGNENTVTGNASNDRNSTEPCGTPLHRALPLTEMPRTPIDGPLYFDMDLRLFTRENQSTCFYFPRYYTRAIRALYFSHHITDKASMLEKLPALKPPFRPSGRAVGRIMELLRANSEELQTKVPEWNPVLYTEYEKLPTIGKSEGFTEYVGESNYQSMFSIAQCHVIEILLLDLAIYNLRSILKSLSYLGKKHSTGPELNVGLVEQIMNAVVPPNLPPIQQSMWAKVGIDQIVWTQREARLRKYGLYGDEGAKDKVAKPKESQVEKGQKLK